MAHPRRDARIPSRSLPLLLLAAAATRTAGDVLHVRVYYPGTYPSACPGVFFINYPPSIAELVVLDAAGANVALATAGAVAAADSFFDDAGTCGCTPQGDARTAAGAAAAIDGSYNTVWASQGAWGGCVHCPCSSSPWLEVTLAQPVTGVSLVRLVSRGVGQGDGANPYTTAVNTRTLMGGWVVSLRDGAGGVVADLAVASAAGVIGSDNVVVWELAPPPPPTPTETGTPSSSATGTPSPTAMSTASITTMVTGSPTSTAACLLTPPQDGLRAYGASSGADIAFSCSLTLQACGAWCCSVPACKMYAFHASEGLCAGGAGCWLISAAGVFLNEVGWQSGSAITSVTVSVTGTANATATSPAVTTSRAASSSATGMATAIPTVTRSRTRTRSSTRTRTRTRTRTSAASRSAAGTPAPTPSFTPRPTDYNFANGCGHGGPCFKSPSRTINPNDVAAPTRSRKAK